MNTKLSGHIKHLIWGKDPKKTIIRTLFLGIFTYILLSFVLSIHVTRGISMEPTIADGTFHMGNRLAYRLSEPKRGDIVVIPMLGTKGQRSYLKRILGLPGETIAFESGDILINGIFYPEPYRTESDWNKSPFLLKEDEYYVVGDNRSVPIERHKQFVTPRKRLQSKILF